LFINIVFVLISFPVCFWINNEQTNIMIGNAAMNLDFIFLFIMTALKNGIMNTEKMEEKNVSYQLNEKLAEHHWKTLTAYMDTCKPYQDEDCSLHSLSVQTKIPEHHLTKLLNAHGGTSFADFINKYRLKEAEIHLLDKSKYRKTIDTIAGECGFGSRSSFYRAFTRAYKTTPSAYQKLHDKDSEA